VVSEKYLFFIPFWKFIANVNNCITRMNDKFCSCVMYKNIIIYTYLSI
jgi:hypothetical protein